MQTGLLYYQVVASGGNCVGYMKVLQYTHKHGYEKMQIKKRKDFLDKFLFSLLLLLS
jgi:hypothetical protein